MTVLIFNRFYLPGFKGGGTIVSLANLISALGSEVKFLVVTTDRDLKDASQYAGIEIGAWHNVGSASVLYLGAKELTFARLISIVRDARPEVIYLNSFFDVRFSAQVLIAKRIGKLPQVQVLLAPRGELSPGALALKTVRKKIYTAFLRMIGALRGVHFHASNEAEAAEIERVLNVSKLRGHIHVASDLPSFPKVTSDWQPRVTGAPLRICFLSRISPIKNLLGAIRAIGMMQSSAEFTIYGPQEDLAYWRLCQVELEKLPPHIKFVYGGEVNRRMVHGELAKHDVFFFPSFGENYGHVIPEALAAGLPVVISDKTPWRDLKERGIGYDGAIDDAAFASELDYFATLSSETQIQMRCACRRYIENIAQNSRDIDDNRRLFFEDPIS